MSADAVSMTEHEPGTKESMPLALEEVYKDPCCSSVKCSGAKELTGADMAHLRGGESLLCAAGTTSTSGSTAAVAEDAVKTLGGVPEEDCPPVTAWAILYVVGVFLLLVSLLSVLFCTLPSLDRSMLKFPRNIEELRSLRDYLSVYTKDHTLHVALFYSTLYISLQTFAFPGTPLLSVLGGSLFGATTGFLLVACTATLGASSCFFMARAIGRPLVRWLWPHHMRSFSAEVAKRRDKLWNYMVFLRVTPALPNPFVNIASPLVDVPFSVFLPATFIGLLPGTFIQVRTGLTLGELKSLRDLGDTKSTVALLCIGVVSLLPILVNKAKKD